MKAFEDLINGSLTEGTFVKLSLGNYHGAEEHLKHVYVREILLKREVKLAFTYRYKTRDIVKNYDKHEGVGLILDYLNNGFKSATLFTTEKDTIWVTKRSGTVFLRNQVPTFRERPALAHDREKHRALAGPTLRPYLHDLNITDHTGKVYKNAQDKYKQINHFVELLKPLLAEVNPKSIKKVVDMGSGKGYLTFALYDYLHHVLQLNVEVSGVEFRSNLVDLCNNIARKSEFSGLHFVEGTIADYQAGQIDLLMALHACDTATDDAIYQGVRSNAKLIVVAPCCHKQIRREMEQHTVHQSIQTLTRFGIFLERQAEMLTDAIRALILEYHGYKTKVFEFVSDAHTPKNVLVVGIRSKDLAVQEREEIRARLQALKTHFGIGQHYLETRFKL
ncbi:SAM-dependent methyltransferase [Olivibacter sp. SDN3]|uniref:class I SAM-dependent methyltransferase n=1 Tax=Olivibacter sp. SDN3 TaxID=2764720 RepID=UPI002106CF97|nr:SAM-dependent methyltransferase [Olivibacter sp. SDN3]